MRAIALEQLREALTPSGGSRMHDLGLKRGWLIYRAWKVYSLGDGGTAVPAKLALSPPDSIAG